MNYYGVYRSGKELRLVGKGAFKFERVFPSNFFLSAKPGENVSFFGGWFHAFDYIKSFRLSNKSLSLMQTLSDLLISLNQANCVSLFSHTKLMHGRIKKS